VEQNEEVGVNDTGRLVRQRAPAARVVVVAAALLLAMVPALQPLLSDDLTCGYDNTFQFWRAVQIDALWRQGVVYSRWAPDMAQGFGFPVFLFASPFPASLVALLHRVGLAWARAMNATFALGMVLGGLGMFWLAQGVFGRGRPWPVSVEIGFVAAVAYVYAPFQAYDVFNRGSLWEGFAWAFPPFALLGVHRWAVERDRRFLLLGVGGLAATVLSHHVFAFLFGPVLAVWVIAQAIARRDRNVVARGVLVGVLALGVTAFFWLPPLLERGYVQTERLLGTWVFDFRYNFLSWRHLLAPPRAADPLLLNDWPEKSLGLVPVLVALLPAIGWRRMRRWARWQVGSLWGLVVLMALLTLPLSLPAWERIPLLAYVQFPWRCLGPAAFCVALLIGAGYGALADRVGWAGTSWRVTILAGVVGAIVAGSAWGWFYPAHCAAVGDTSLAAMIAWERATDTIGTTAKGEYLPVWVQRFPDAPVDADGTVTWPLERLPAEGLPAGGRILAAEYGALDASIELATPIAFRARYLAFFYPGWRVTVDGQPTDGRPEPETGLLTFEVPEGQHRIEVTFGETPLRRTADVLAVVSVAAVAWAYVKASRATASSREERDEAAHGWRQSLALLAVTVAMVVVKVGVADRMQVLWRGTRLQHDGQLAGAAEPRNVTFGRQAVLLGIEALPESFRPDHAPDMTLYWRALTPTGEDWHVGLTLVGPEVADGSARERWAVGLRSARWARTPPRIVQWPRDGYARMDFHMDVPPGMPPGTYTLVMALFDRATATPVSVLNAEGNPVGPELALGDVTLLPPDEPPDLASLDVEAADPLRCGPVMLWEAGLDRESAGPGDLVTLRMVWEAVLAPSEDMRVTLVLRDEAGTEVRTWDRPPVAAWWPTRLWQSEQRWVGRAEIRLPGSLESGVYTLALSLAGCDLGSWPLSVEAPERAWRVPQGFTRGGAELGEVVALAGYRIAADTVAAGERLDVALAWEALAEMDISYRVYLHLIEPGGRILTQDDGEPVAWTRPTTGWAVSEVVVDVRSLGVPADAEPGVYEVRVGMYGPDGVRLQTASGQDGIAIGVVRVE